jgi:hypothetical protein
MGKAAYGALMGLGQGISQWGNQMAADVLSKQKEKREFDRQASLLDISQRYQQTQLQETREYNEGQKLEQRTYDEGRKEEEREYKLREATPGTPEYEARQRLQDEELERQKELRAVPYASSASGGSVLSTINPDNYTAESFGPWVEEVTRLMDQEGLSEREAGLVAQTKFPLISKPEATKEADAGAIKSAREDTQEFSSNYDDKQSKIERLVELGLGTPEDLEKLSVTQLDALFRDSRMEFWGVGKGLMDQKAGGLPPPGAKDDPLGIRN